MWLLRILSHLKGLTNCYTDIPNIFKHINMLLLFLLSIPVGANIRSASAYWYLVA